MKDQFRESKALCKSMDNTAPGVLLWFVSVLPIGWFSRPMLICILFVYFLIYLNVKRRIFLSLVRWSKLLYICLISQYVNDYDNVPKPVGYHWQSLAINTLSVNVHCFYTIFFLLVTLFLLVCHTVLI